MNLDDLRAAQVDERGTDSLQPLPPTFYAEAADYLADLRERRDRLAARADDPFDSEEVRQLTDELETAEEVVEAIYERRVGKLVKRASLAAAGMPADEEGLTEEERVLFADLVERLEAHRATVLDDLAAGEPDTADAATDDRSVRDDRPAPTDGEAASTTASDAPPGATESAGGPEPEPDGGGASDSTSAGSSADDPDRVTVRITAEVGEIYGVDDRVYTLGEEDVVSLPSVNARPLLERDAAQRVE
ncbi:MAG: hypothetical protein ABEJ92_10180 [Halobacteriales archaeon]